MPPHNSFPMPPLFPGLQTRAAGILLHPTALPSPFGIGNLGEEARAFVDFVAASGLTWWQVCPLGPTGFGDSPYACFSAFAGNPHLIDPRPLVAAGLLADADLAPLRKLSPTRVEYGFLWENFWPVMDKAWAAAKAKPEALKGFGDFAAFTRDKAGWLDDYALFMALKRRHAGAPWHEWPDAFKIHASALRVKPDPALADAVGREKFIQFLFSVQWAALREYSARAGVKILGDAPIYLAHDSSEVWARTDLFELDAKLKPAFVAGVPPDYFSAAGQLWGNPLYDWKRNKDEGFAWWISRLRENLALTDALRIDHFRAFHDYWKIPAGAPDARAGKWADGPGLDFFKTVRRELPGRGTRRRRPRRTLAGRAHAARRHGTARMAVLQFAFGSDGRNAYLPHNHAVNSVVYPGTHDNDTTTGWYAGADARTRDRFRKYFGADGSAPAWTALLACLSSTARLAVIPAQDLLNLGSEARFQHAWRPRRQLGLATLRRTTRATPRLHRSAPPRTRRTHRPPARDTILSRSRSRFLSPERRPYRPGYGPTMSRNPASYAPAVRRWASL